MLIIFFGEQTVRYPLWRRSQIQLDNISIWCTLCIWDKTELKLSVKTTNNIFRQIEEYGNVDICTKLVQVWHLCVTATSWNKQTRRVNSISSCSLPNFGAGVGFTTVLEFLSRWCLVLRRKSNDNIVDISCSNLGECSASTKGNTTSPKTTHRTNITVKPRNSTSKRFKRPSDSEAMREREFRETLFSYEVILDSRASVREDICVKSCVSSLFTIPVSFDSSTIKQILSLLADTYYSSISHGQSEEWNS